MDRYIQIINPSKSSDSLEPQQKKGRFNDSINSPIVSTSTLEQGQSNNVPKFQYLFNNFFKLISSDGEKLKASCNYCEKIISASTTSSGNLLSHIKVSTV